MEIEQLKLILETLQGLGHEAGSLAVLYLWLQFTGGVLANVSFVGVFVGIAYIVYKAIKMSQGSDETETFLCEMRDQLGVGSRGILTKTERFSTMTALRQLAAKHKEKQ